MSLVVKGLKCASKKLRSFFNTMCSTLLGSATRRFLYDLPLPQAMESLFRLEKNFLFNRILIQNLRIGSPAFLPIDRYYKSAIERFISRLVLNTRRYFIPYLQYYSDFLNWCNGLCFICVVISNQWMVCKVNTVRYRLLIFN